MSVWKLLLMVDFVFSLLLLKSQVPLKSSSSIWYSAVVACVPSLLTIPCWGAQLGREGCLQKGGKPVRQDRRPRSS